MVYEVFQTAVSEELKNRLGDDYEIAIHKIPKNNGTLLDGLTIFHLNEIAKMCIRDRCVTAANQVIGATMIAVTATAITIVPITQEHLLI